MKKIATLVTLAMAFSLAACSDDSDKSAALKDVVPETAQEAGDNLQEQAANLKETITENVESAKQQAEQVVEQAETAVTDKVESVKQEAKELVSTETAVTDKVESVKQEAKELVSTETAVTDKVESVKQDAQDLVGTDTAAKVTESVDKTKATVASVATATTAAASGDSQGSTMDHTLGKKIYSSSCQACHATGAAGAPKLGDKANWAPRIATGMDKMSANAINGFRGSQGYMPAKGGFSNLSDDEVTAAVAYMVAESK